DGNGRARTRAFGHAAAFDYQGALAGAPDREAGTADPGGRIAGAVRTRNGHRADAVGRIAEGGAEGADHLDPAAMTYRQSDRRLIADMEIADRRRAGIIDGNRHPVAIVDDSLCRYGAGDGQHKRKGGYPPQ